MPTRCPQIKIRHTDGHMHAVLASNIRRFFLTRTRLLILKVKFPITRGERAIPPCSIFSCSHITKRKIHYSGGGGQISRNITDLSRKKWLYSHFFVEKFYCIANFLVGNSNLILNRSPMDTDAPT